jgi:hypothetical protein
MKSDLASSCALAALAIAAIAAPAIAGRPAYQDPFENKPKKKVEVAKPVARETVIAPPAIEVRQSECKGATPSGQQVQSQPCMYLVREVKLQGVFRTQEKPEAFLFAEPTKQTITVREGDRFFDGRVVSIREAGPSGDGQIVLEKVTKKQIGKKVTETKELVTLGLASASL